MRNKIEFKSNKSHNDSNNNINRLNKSKPANLKQLWKWLKLIAK